MLSREKVSLNAIAFDSTFRLIDQALLLGVNLQEVRTGAVCLTASQYCKVTPLKLEYRCFLASEHFPLVLDSLKSHALLWRYFCLIVQLR